MASGITHVRCACVGDLGASRRVGFDDPMRMMVGDRADWVGRARGAKGAGEAMGARVSPASGSCGQPLDDWNGRARFSTFLLILARDSRPRTNTHGSNRCAFASRPLHTTLLCVPCRRMTSHDPGMTTPHDDSMPASHDLDAALIGARRPVETALEGLQFANQNPAHPAKNMTKSQRRDHALASQSPSLARFRACPSP